MKTSPAAWIHKKAREAYPTNEPDSVEPERFFEILGQIDTREKFNTVCASLPEEEAPNIEMFHKFLFREFLPAQRSAALGLARRLPPRRGGGAPSKMPSRVICREICAYISKKHAECVPLGTAQRQAGEKWNKSFRMIQRIWALRGMENP